MFNKFNNIIRRQIYANNLPPIRQAITTATGAVLPRPERTSLGLVRIFLAVIPGLLIGATISKYMANFLEENELFVPSDDDDDDD